LVAKPRKFRTADANPEDFLAGGCRGIQQDRIGFGPLDRGKRKDPAVAAVRPAVVHLPLHAELGDCGEIDRIAIPVEIHGGQLFGIPVHEVGPVLRLVVPGFPGVSEVIADDVVGPLVEAAAGTAAEEAEAVVSLLSFGHEDDSALAQVGHGRGGFSPRDPSPDEPCRDHSQDDDDQYNNQQLNQCEAGGTGWRSGRFRVHDPGGWFQRRLRSKPPNPRRESRAREGSGTAISATSLPPVKLLEVESAS